MAERCKVLIIDDDRDITRGLSVRFHAAGYDVLTAASGTTGLEMATESVPDSILLDIQMPGMDGFEVLRRLKQQAATRTIPVIVVSANVVDQVRTRALASGASHFASKPFQAAKLVAAVHDAIMSARISTSP